MTASSRAASSRWVALAGIALGLLAVGLDVTVLSLALPSLAGVFRATEAQLQWFVTAYTLALTAAMLPAGLIGDRIGRRRLMVASLVVFGVASATCAAAVTRRGAEESEGVKLAPRAERVWLYSSLLITPFDISSSASRCCTSTGEEASLIVAASCSVMIPLDCSNRTSGLGEGSVASFCWAPAMLAVA